MMDDYSLDKSSFTHFVSDDTCNDLDFDDLFAVCDNTSSKIGQQCLYAKLRTADCIPNNIDLFKRSVLITGSNMAGKTTFIRSLGLNTITAFSINTCFAKSFSIGHFNLDSTIRVGDSILAEKSYYLEEVLRIKNIINNSQNNTPSLILLDELYKGTNAVERIACAKAVLSYLSKNSIVVATTHDL